MIYNPIDWYWAIGGDGAAVWSSARAMSVPVDDVNYVAWLAELGEGGGPSRLDTMEELRTLMSQQYPAGTLETYCSFKRWQREQGGMTLTSGMPIKTDDRAQAKITGVYAAAQAMPSVTTTWHAADGADYPLDATQITTMNEELLGHIDDCFAISADVLAQIAAGTITTHAEVDAAFAAGPATAAAERGWRWPK